MPANQENVSLTAPTPGFSALRPEPQYYELTKEYKEALNRCITITVLFKQQPTQREAEAMVKKMDRIHDFYAGQSIGFFFNVKNILRDADPFNPGAAMNKVNDLVKVIDSDLDRYIKVVQQIEPDQVRLNLT